MPPLRGITLITLASVVGLLFSGSASAASVPVELDGVVVRVQNSQFASGPTQGIAVGAVLPTDLIYDDTTAQSSGGFTSFELTALQIVVPDSTQGGGSFTLVPAELNSATRIVFAGAEFHGLVLPDNVTGFTGLAVFGVENVAFEAQGFAGNEFKFNVGTPIVEGFWRPRDAPAAVPGLGGPYGIAALAGLLLIGLATLTQRHRASQQARS